MLHVTLYSRTVLW